MMKNKHENGQALVLFALGIMVLLGFTALAIDGGMIFTDRRHWQNAADSASLAGGGAAAQYLDTYGIDYSNWDCTGNVIYALNAAENSAVNRAASNDVVIDYDLSDQNGVDAQCSDSPNLYIDVITQVAGETRTSFAHLLYDGPVAQYVEAVTRVYGKMPFGLGNAVFALNDAECSGNKYGAIFTGSSTVIINGGGVHTNYCLTGDGNQLLVDTTDGEIIYAGEDGFNVTHPEGFIPTPELGDAIDPDEFYIPPPECSGNADYDAIQHGEGQIPAGNYPSIRVDGDATLDEGLYCLTGDFSVEAGGILNGDGVTIYMISGDFTTGGNSTVDLSAPPEDSDPSPALADVLIYLAPGNTGEVVLTGTSDSTYEGIVFAPDGDISAGGNEAGISFHTTFVAQNITIVGNASFEIDYYQSFLYGTPTKLELYR